MKSNRLLDSLRNELEKIEAKLEAGKGKQRDLLYSMDERQRQVAIQEELIREQYRMRRDLQDTLALLEFEITDKEKELSKFDAKIDLIDLRKSELSKALAKSMLTGSRLSKFGTLEFLFGSKSWHDLIARRSLIKKLEDTEKSYLKSLSQSVDTLQTAETEVYTQTLQLKNQKDLLVMRKGESYSLEQELRSQSGKLLEQKQSLSKQLSEIEGNQTLLETRRREIEDAQKAIGTMISKIAKGESLAGVSIAALKGLLPWPVKGKVAEKFGLVKNNRLWTVTENPGIELNTTSDEPVKSVADGKVSTITWLRGFGNVCILEHAGSFFTVYAGLGQVNVTQNDLVTAGTVLGFASFDPANGEYRLHFELWSGKDKKDPLEWLSR